MIPLMSAVHQASLPQTAYDGNAAYPSPESVNLFTLNDLLRMLRVRWKMILAAAGGAAVVALLAVSMMTPAYLGTALVMVDEQQRHVFSEQSDPSVLSNLPTDPSSIESQVQVLQSHALAGQVVDKLGLVHDPEFNGSKRTIMDVVIGFVPLLLQALPPATPQADAQKLREQAIGKLLSKLDVHAVGLSTVIAVGFRSSSAVKAARIANTIADTYVSNLAAAKSDAAEHAAKWLADRVNQLGRQAAAAEAAVQQYKAENGLIDTSNGTPLTDQQLSDLTTQLIQAQGDEAQARAKLARTRTLLQSGRGADTTDVVASPLIIQLRAQEATLLQQKANLSTRYGPLHTALRDVNAQLAELKQKIAEEVKRIVGTAANDAAVAGTRVAAIKNEMAKATSTTAALDKARVRLSELSANATSARALYQSYLDRMKQTQQGATFSIPNAHVASAASVPLAPASPKRLLIVGGATLAGLLIGFLAALVADRLCNGFRSASELQGVLRLPVLGSVPNVKQQGEGLDNVTMQVLRQPQSQFAEALRGVEIGLIGNEDSGTNLSAKGKAYLVTSALPADGKTSMSVALARRLAISGHRVVIVDADQRRPRVAAALGLRNVRFSLDDYFKRRCSLDQAMNADPHSPVVALSNSGATQDTAVNWWSAFSSLITRLRGMADFVIIDSPPVLAVHDAELLARIADGTLFVVRWEKTPREAASAALELLRDRGAKLIGSVLVRTNPDHYQYYAYGYRGAPALASYYGVDRGQA